MVNGYEELRIFIYLNFDDTITFETKHMHYAFDDRFNHYDVKKEDCIYIMAEIQEHCESENLNAKFMIL